MQEVNIPSSFISGHSAAETAECQRLIRNLVEVNNTYLLLKTNGALSDMHIV